MARRVIGLDIGTYSVKVARLEARTRGAGFDLISYREVLLSRFMDAEHEKTEQELQSEALDELKIMSQLDGSWVATGLPSAEAQIRSLEVPFSNRKKIEAVLPGLMDSHLPFPVENLLYTWVSVREKDEKSHLLVGFARKEAVAKTLEHLHKAELDPRFVTFKAAALFDLLGQVVPKESAQQSMYCIVDIGHKSTGICIGDKERIHLARSIPRGGYHVTQAYSQMEGISLADAEKQKIAAMELTPSISQAYYPIAREIRQTILAMEAETHRKLEGIFLVGGASKALGLPEFLSSLLGVRVSLIDKFSQFHLSPAVSGRTNSIPPAEAGLALSYAIMCENASNREPRFNFRKDEFSFSGEFDYMRQRARTLVAWSCVVLFLFAISGSVRNFFLTRRVEFLTEMQRQLCKQITGSPLDGTNCLIEMRNEMARTQIPKWSATDAYLELAKAIPPSIELKVTNLDVSSDLKIQLTAQAPGLDTDTAVVDAIKQNACFHKVEKSGKKQIQSGTQFVVKAEFDCERQNTMAQAVSPKTLPKEK